MYFICTNTNNWIIANRLRCKHHTKSPLCVTPLCLQSCTTIHTKIHPYVPVISLHFIHTSIIKTQTNFVTSFTKTPNFSENMKMPREFTKNTGWGRANNKKHPREFFASPLNMHHHTRTLHHNTKRLKPAEESSFDLLPTVILTDIEIWVPGLKHCDKFKAVVSQINSMYNPVLFSITHDLCKPYHNFGVFQWYNEAY